MDDGLTPALKLLAAVTCTVHDVERAADACVAIESSLRCAYLDTPREPQTDQAAREIAAAYWLLRRLREDLEQSARLLKAAHDDMRTDAEKAKAAANTELTNTTVDAEAAPGPSLH